MYTFDIQFNYVPHCVFSINQFNILKVVVFNMTWSSSTNFEATNT